MTSFEPAAFQPPFLTIKVERAPSPDSGFMAVGAYKVRAGTFTREAWGPSRPKALQRLLSIFRANGHGGKRWILVDPAQPMSGAVPERRRGYRAARRSALQEAATAQAAVL